MFELLKFSSAETLAGTVAERFLREIAAGTASSASPYLVALSGGRIAARFFSILARAPDAARLTEAPVHFFWADERCVEPEDPQSNFGLADTHLLSKIGVPKDRVHRIRGEAEPQLAALEAEAELRQQAHRCAGQPVLDLVFLGMGEDGHVASLFPGESAELVASPAVFRPVLAPKPPPRRISLGYGALAVARQVWVLAVGPGKERALEQSLSDSAKTPLSLVLQRRTHTRIFTDIASVK